MMNELERVSNLAVNYIIYIMIKDIVEAAVNCYTHLYYHIYDIICLTIYCLTYAYLVIML